MVRRFRSSKLWGAAVAVVCLAAACSGDSGERGSESATGPNGGEWGPPGWEVVETAPDLPSLAVGEPLWGSEQLEAVRSLTSVALHGDAVVLEGHGADDRERLAVVDGPTGRLRWAIDAFGDLPGGEGATWDPPGSAPDNILVPLTEALTIAEDGDEWVVLVNYKLVPAADATPEHGVAALSSADGRVLWKTPFISSAPTSESTPAEQLIPGPTVAHGDLVVASAVPFLPVPDPADPAYLNRVELVAVDVASGRPSWRQTGAWPLAVADDAVLALVADEATGPTGSDALPVTTVALDPATGERLWDLADRHPMARLVLTAGDAVVVDLMDDTAPSETLVLDAGTGEELASFGTGVVIADDCDADDSVIACPVMTEPSDIHSGALATFDVGDRDPTVAARTIEEVIGDGGAPVRGVAEGRIFVGDLEHASVALDRAGDRVGPDLPGVLLALSDRFLVVEEPRDELEPSPDAPAYTVYAVSPGS